jgi:hypothetical protein
MFLSIGGQLSSVRNKKGLGILLRIDVSERNPRNTARLSGSSALNNKK